jgi:hypothetical protein
MRCGPTFAVSGRVEAYRRIHRFYVRIRVEGQGILHWHGVQRIEITQNVFRMFDRVKRYGKVLHLHVVVRAEGQRSVSAVNGLRG